MDLQRGYPMAADVYDRIQVRRRELAGQQLADVENSLMTDLLNSREREYIRELFAAHERRPGRRLRDSDPDPDRY